MPRGRSNSFVCTISAHLEPRHAFMLETLKTQCGLTVSEIVRLGIETLHEDLERGVVDPLMRQIREDLEEE